MNLWRTDPNNAELKELSFTDGKVAEIRNKMSTAMQKYILADNHNIPEISIPWITEDQMARLQVLINNVFVDAHDVLKLNKTHSDVVDLCKRGYVNLPFCFC